MLVHSDRLTEHFSNPRNFGVLPQANAVALVGAMRWGDAIKLMLQIDPATDTIIDARFQTYGCSCAIASSSAITEMVTGKTVEEASQITAADITAYLGGLPREKMYCAVMGYEALQIAVANYRGDAQRAEAVLLCKCFGVDEDMITRTIRLNQLTEPEQVTSYTKAGRGCVTCFKEIEGVLARVNGEMSKEGLITPMQAYRVGSADPLVFEVKPRGDGSVTPQPPAVSALSARPAMRPAPPRPATSAAGVKRGTPEQIRLVENAIDDLRPRLQRDGGDCELVDVDGNTVFIKLSGTCVDCQLASVTLSGVQARLAEKLGLPLRVVSVQ
jgi:NifU-like protein